MTPLALLIAAIVFYSRSPNAMVRVIVGSLFLLILLIANFCVNFFLPRFLSTGELGLYVMAFALIIGVMNSLAVLIIGTAAFVDRGPQEPVVDAESVGPPTGSNPYQAPSRE